MKLEVGKSYVTRDGNRIVRILATDVRCDRQPVVGVERTPNSADEHDVNSYCLDGRFYTGGEDSCHDLVAEYVPPKKPKKLYAFRNLLHNRIDWYEGVSSKFPMVEERAPEYDITFPGEQP